MKRKMMTTLLAMAFVFNAEAVTDVVDYVNTFIGTSGMGHTFPGACVPFGAVQLSPDTDTIPHNVNGEYQPEAYAYCAGYRHDDPTIVGFSHTHLSGTGHSDLGDILLMPQTGALRLTPGTSDNPDAGYRQRFYHSTECAWPGYYEVTLADDGVRVQLTATARVGVHRYTFPTDAPAQRMVVDLTHGIYNYEGKTLWCSLRVENDTLLTGYRVTQGWARCNYTYFAITFSRPVINYGYRDRRKEMYRGFWRKLDPYHNFPDMGGRSVVAYFDFDTTCSEALMVKVGLSAVSAQGALQNLLSEAGGKSFDTLCREARTAWQRELSSVAIEGTEDQKTMFYTSLYHTMINPSVYSDVDGRYRGVDGAVHEGEGFQNYTVFSLWDTYRALHPLLAWLRPERNTDMVRSMLAHQRQSANHVLPVWSLMGNEGWCMTGYHAASAVADALVKGATLDSAMVLNALRSTSTWNRFPGLSEYIRKGFAPFDNDATAVSNTLEYAYDDFAIAQAAYALGNSAMAAEYEQRALNYRNIFNPITGFATPRYRNGLFKTDMDPLQTYGEGFIEGNSWNYSFHVPQDVRGLINTVGGDRRFIERLDSLFTMHLPEHYYADNEDITADCLVGGYVHGNEPSHHVPYLYTWTSHPWLTQERLFTIMSQMYRNAINGLSGNDDCGQMSAWYVFTTLGFYPVCPGTDQYVIGAPFVTRADVALPDGKHLVIKAPKLSVSNRYVQRVLLNGVPHSRLYFTHSELSSGGEIEFQMGDKPNRQHGKSPIDKPFSLSDNHQ